MALKNINPTSTKAWAKLQEHFKELDHTHIKHWFETDANRANRFTIKWDDFFVDYSKNRLTQETINLFCDLAEEVDLKGAITSCFFWRKNKSD